MQHRPRPVLLLVGATAADPMDVVIEGYGLRMVVVNKEVAAPAALLLGPALG